MHIGFYNFLRFIIGYCLENLRCLVTLSKWPVLWFICCTADIGLECIDYSLLVIFVLSTSKIFFIKSCEWNSFFPVTTHLLNMRIQK